jgi:SAM-dependent methyltransferase
MLTGIDRLERGVDHPRPRCQNAAVPSNKTGSASIFERTAVHDQPVLTPAERARIAALRRLVPPEARSVLEVGCGDGAVINGLGRRLVVGADLSRRSLARVEKPRLQADIFGLPFGDGSFDLVLCAEVLEHLEPARLPEAAAELARVARRHLVVAVPDREDLLSYTHRCPSCGEEFHLHGHRSSMGAEQVRALLPGARVDVVEQVWPVRPYSRRLLELRTRRLGLWRHSEFTLCPRCGNTRIEDHERRPLYLLFEALNFLRHPLRTDRRWVMVRFVL